MSLIYRLFLVSRFSYFARVFISTKTYDEAHLAAICIKQYLAMRELVELLDTRAGKRISVSFLTVLISLSSFFVLFALVLSYGDNNNNNNYYYSRSK